MKYDNELKMTIFTDIEYIQIGIANAYGKDKLTWAERLLWVENHKDKLWELADEAKEPFQYLKALHAYKDVMEGKPTGYAIGLDSTASGVQVFACLSGCHKTAKAVNLIGDGIRHNMYTEVVEHLDIQVEPEILKKAVMTHFYQSQKYQVNTFGDKLPLFYKAMETALPGASEVLEIAKKVQMLVDDKYSFYTPAGHEVLIRQKIPVDYKIESKPEVNNLKAYYFTQRRTEFGKKVSHKGESLDKSVGANIAHVCDAWLASETVTRCKYLWGFDVYHVHDKFFCSPKNANRMRLVIRELLVELCESNYLEEVVIDITGLEDYEYVKQSNNLAELVKTADYFVC